MQKSLFGNLPSGRNIDMYIIGNDDIKAKILTYGATLQSLIFKGRDVVLGYDELDGYLNNDGYLGAVVGRYANRIGGASFRLNGKRYDLNANDGKNTLHGGITGYDKVVWEVESADDTSISLKYFSPDGEEGFPAGLLVGVRYSVEGDKLIITYTAVSDNDTVVNLTNHTYFNLYEEGYTEDQFVTLYADNFTPVDKSLIPTGQIISVKDTPMDFTVIKRIGKDIEEEYEQLILAGGYDHNFIINGEGLRKFAEVCSPKSGVKMVGYTDNYGVQFYTGNFLTERMGKNGRMIGRRGGFCLETQNFPNAVNEPEFPSPILKKGDVYHTVTQFEFSDY